MESNAKITLLQAQDYPATAKTASKPGPRASCKTSQFWDVILRFLIYIDFSPPLTFFLCFTTKLYHYKIFWQQAIELNAFY